MKIARAYTQPPGRRRVRARLPRPHQPDHGADRQEHALQALASARSPPRSTACRCRYPFRDGLTGAEGRGRRDQPDREGDRRRQRRRDHHRADPGRGRLHRPGRGLPARARRVRAAPTAIVFVADEIQTGFCRTGDWFACDHEGVVPDLITTAKGIAGGLPLAGVTGRAEIMDAVHVGRPRRHLRRQPGGLRRSARRRSTTMRQGDLNGAARRIDELMIAAPRGPGRAAPAVIGDVRGRGAMIAVELVDPGTDRARRRLDRRGRQGLPRRTASSC